MSMIARRMRVWRCRADWSFGFAGAMVATGELNRARVVVERANGTRVLDLTGVSAQSTPDGLRFEFETIASDYLLK